MDEKIKTLIDLYVEKSKNLIDILSELKPKQTTYPLTLRAKTENGVIYKYLKGVCFFSSFLKWSDILYAAICIWDPFREESPDNWSLYTIKNEISEQLEEYLKIIDKYQINMMYLIYRVLKKGIFEITISPQGKVSIKPEIKNLGINDKNTKGQLNKLLFAHEKFKHTTKNRIFYYIPTPFFIPAKFGSRGAHY